MTYTSHQNLILLALAKEPGGLSYRDLFDASRYDGYMQFCKSAQMLIDAGEIRREVHLQQFTAYLTDKGRATLAQGQGKALVR